MFPKLSVVVTSVLITLAAAIPNTTPPVTPPTSNQCSSVVPSSDASASALLAHTVIGNDCGGTTVTCDTPDKAWGGLIAINCIPITL
ncbi:hypothetical protein B0H17DRAFT_1200334 [Mycena rosella]|uniref:Hydrophobin n=1 Tax=Mycena rosella TaxID=1033263 RepID=A0AAD7DIU6_MYCRO|nr:hypothetical protein B0H17DRAFT_1200334 [Mycena rosella]